MAILTVTPIDKTGVDLTATIVAAAAAGDSVAASSGLMFYAKNTDGSPHTVTIVAPVSAADCSPYGSLPVSNIVVSLPATTGEQAFTIPLGYAVNGSFNLTYDAVTDVKVGVYSLS